MERPAASADTYGQDDSESPQLRPVVSKSRLVMTAAKRKGGGWITFPFISGSVLGLCVAQSGLTSNLIVYLIERFNVKSIDAAQINNIVNGCTSVAPLVGAVISDSYFGCFSVVAVSTFISFLSTILFTLTATVSSLRPPPCAPSASEPCRGPSAAHYGVLILGVALLSAGAGGTRFNTAALGAAQFDRAADQNSFMNWYFVVLYAGSIAGATAIVYVQDNVGWGLGFGLCAAANALALVALLLGGGSYRRPKPEGSPFTGLARVLVAAARKSVMALPPPDSTSPAADHYHMGSGEEKSRFRAPTRKLRYLNRAALVMEGDTNPDGSVARPWLLCTVDQVEELKAISSILPLWSTSIFLSISIGIQGSLTILQALTVDRSLGRKFSVPPGSLIVASLATVAVVLPLLDRAIYPAWRRLTGRVPTSLQRIGAGHAFNMAGMVVAALVERKRLRLVRRLNLTDLPGSVVPMSIVWLLGPLAALGLGEALHFPGQVALYYQEFPRSLKSTSTGMIALSIALGFYLSTAVVDLVRRTTDWLPDNINAGKMDMVFWLLAGVTGLNSLFYLLFAKLYKYQSADEEDEEEKVMAA